MWAMPVVIPFWVLLLGSRCPDRNPGLPFSWQGYTFADELMTPFPKPRGFWDYALFALFLTGALVWIHMPSRLRYPSRLLTSPIKDDEYRFIRYAVARFGAFSNITWDLGNDPDSLRDE